MDPLVLFERFAEESGIAGGDGAPDKLIENCGVSGVEFGGAEEGRYGLFAIAVAPVDLGD